MSLYNIYIYRYIYYFFIPFPIEQNHEVCGASRGCRGWPTSERLKKVRGWLRGLHARLEKLMGKWAKSEDQKDARRAMLTAAVAAGAFSS